MTTFIAGLVTGAIFGVGPMVWFAAAQNIAAQDGEKALPEGFAIVTLITISLILWAGTVAYLIF